MAEQSRQEKSSLADDYGNATKEYLEGVSSEHLEAIKEIEGKIAELQKEKDHLEKNEKLLQEELERRKEE